jgi:hypothetical protein
MEGNSMFRKHVEEKDLHKSRRVYSVMCQDEYGLLGKVVNDYQDSGDTAGGGKLLNEIHRYGIPWLLGNRKLLERSIGSVSQGFGSGTGGTGTNVVLHKCPESWSSIFPTNQLKGLSEVSGQGMIVLVLKYTKT